MDWPRALILLSALWVLPHSVQAHEVRPAYLELKQTTTDTFEMLWKVPAMGDNLRLGLYVRWPETTEVVSETRGFFQSNAYIERCAIRDPKALVESTIAIDGLRSTLTDVLVRIERLDGSTQVVRLTPETPTMVVQASPSRWQLAWTYLVLGVEHILFGIDHLLFVLALVLLVKEPIRLVGTITSFTVAHSITLAAARSDLCMFRAAGGSLHRAEHRICCSRNRAFTPRATGSDRTCPVADRIHVRIASWARIRRCAQ